jgi:GxxExxY protein
MSTVREPAADRMRVDGPLQELTYGIIGAAMAAHNKLGPGLKESAYHHALTIELQEAGLSCLEEKPIEILLDGTSIGLLYLDLLVEDLVVVEVKAIPHMLTNEELAQVITYLAATAHGAGLLINFGRTRLEYPRVLPPRKLDAWRNRVRRYVWTPKKA